jgi:hypothetical protein
LNILYMPLLMTIKRHFTTTLRRHFSEFVQLPRRPHIDMAVHDETPGNIN